MYVYIYDMYIYIYIYMYTYYIFSTPEMLESRISGVLNLPEGHHRTLVDPSRPDPVGASYLFRGLSVGLFGSMTGLGFMAMVHGSCPKDSPADPAAGWDGLGLDMQNVLMWCSYCGII